jgi:hypothetical protein
MVWLVLCSHVFPARLMIHAERENSWDRIISITFLIISQMCSYTAAILSLPPQMYEDNNASFLNDFIEPRVPEETIIMILGLEVHPSPFPPRTVRYRPTGENGLHIRSLALKWLLSLGYRFAAMKSKMKVDK